MPPTTPKTSYLRHVLVALYLPFLLCLALPLDIFLGNAAEVGYPLTALLPILGTLFISLAFIFVLPMLVPSPLFRRVYFAGLVALSLIAWVTSNFLFGNYGMFNGEALTIDDRSLSAYLELAAGIALIVVLVRSTTLVSTLGDLVIGVFLLTLAFGVYQYLNIEEPDDGMALRSSLSLENMDEAEFSRLSQFSSQGNIVHILLDELQTDVFEQVLAGDPSLEEQLDGFTFFPNTSSVFPYTQMSLPAILSGEVYDNRSSKREYLDRSLNRNGFFQALEQASYTLDFHIHPAFCKSEYDLKCTAVAGNSILPSTLNLVDLSLFKAVPTVFKHAAHNNGMGVFKRFLSEGGYLDSQPGIGFLLFDKFNQNFTVNNGPPTYKFFQSLISHAPQLMESDCTLSGQINPLTMPHMKNQTNCAFHQVTRFLVSLKQADIYDQSLIIISSDHGGNYRDKSMAETLKSRFVHEQHFARGKSTLLVKPLNSRGLLQQSEYPARLSDIPRTVSEIAGLEFEKYGDDIFSRDYNPMRPRAYYFINWKLGAGESDRLNGFRPYRIRGDVREASSWRRVLEKPSSGAGKKDPTNSSP